MAFSYRCFVLLLSALVFGLFERVPTSAAVVDDPYLFSVFEKWVSDHGRVYGSLNEKLQRFGVFKDNFHFIESMKNQSGLAYTVGLSKFADLTNKEFLQRCATYRTPSETKATTPFRTSKDTMIGPLLLNDLIMRSVIERYQKAKEGHHPGVNSSSEIKFWQREATSLKQQLHNLQETNRKLMREEHSGLSIKDLRGLERHFEMSLRSIRSRKVKGNEGTSDADKSSVTCAIVPINLEISQPQEEKINSEAEDSNLCALKLH